MRRSLPSALLAILLVVTAVAPSLAANDLALWRENRRLTAEAALAATPKPYFELDLERRRILLKTRGLTLFELSIQEQGLWGRRLSVGPTSIEKRDALVRPAIRPGDEKTAATLDDQLLELVDMPTSYRLGLAGGIQVEVLPRAAGRWSWLRLRSRIWRWRLTRPLVTLRQRRERREAASVYVVLRPEDAQRLYWSFFEGLDGILIPP